MNLLMPIISVPLGTSSVMAASVSDRVFNIVAMEFELDRAELTRGTRLLGNDCRLPFSIVNRLKMEFEDEFEAAGIDQIPDEHHEVIPTIGKVIAYVEKAIAGKDQLDVYVKQEKEEIVSFLKAIGWTDREILSNRGRI